jgi:hypothetical protein
VTTLPIPGGPTNREIIDLAYLALGVSDNMFGQPPEAYASAARQLRAMMGEWPFNLLGYINEEEPGLRVEEESGIAQSHLTAVAYALAEMIGAGIGKSLSAEARRLKNGSYSRLCSAVGRPPITKYGDVTFTGSGGRRWGYRGRTYFPASV